MNFMRAVESFSDLDCIGSCPSKIDQMNEHMMGYLPRSVECSPNTNGDPNAVSNYSPIYNSDVSHGLPGRRDEAEVGLQQVRKRHRVGSF